jgi:hypothetical protein
LNDYLANKIKVSRAVVGRFRPQQKYKYRFLRLKYIVFNGFIVVLWAKTPDNGNACKA